MSLQYFLLGEGAPTTVLLFVILLVLIFFIRWAFKINHIVDLLEDINEKLKR